MLLLMEKRPGWYEGNDCQVKSVLGVLRDHCIRCGECCLRGSPSLQQEDALLVTNGPIKKKDLFTIRRGEHVYDPVHEELRAAEREFVKVREKSGGKGCLYFDEPRKACTIYENRPLQCRALACWDTSEFLRIYQGPKADRKDLISDGVLLGLMEEHHRKCSYSHLENLVGRIASEGDRVLEDILEALKFDYMLRPFVSKKLGIDQSEMDFVFGRPLVETVTVFGLRVVREKDGTFVLTVDGPST